MYKRSFFAGFPLVSSIANSLVGFIANSIVGCIDSSILRPIVLAFSASLLFSCNGVYTPRPKGYFKIEFPARQYQSFDKPGFPYTFEYPVYANIARDSSFFETTPENPYWINVIFPQFNATIYISYKKIGAPTDQGSVGRRPGNSFDKLKEDAYKMTFKHTAKASSIDDSIMRTPNGVSGVFFHVGGNAATANQFYVTDSTKNFLRGALYFDSTPNEDSLGIVNRFLEQDMRHLINTFKWRSPAPDQSH